MGSRSFSNEHPEYPHLEQADRVGRDLRKDVEVGFESIEGEVDAATTDVSRILSSYNHVLIVGGVGQTTRRLRMPVLRQ